MIHHALFILLALVQRVTHVLARFALRIFVAYGLIVLAFALAAGHALGDAATYGKPLAYAAAISIALPLIDRAFLAALRRLA